MSCQDTSRNERLKVLEVVSAFMRKCLVKYRDRNQSEETAESENITAAFDCARDAFVAAGEIDPEANPTDFLDYEVRDLLRVDIESFVQSQPLEGVKLYDHCDMLIYIGCFEKLREIAGHGVSMHVSHLILEALPIVPREVRIAHQHFGNKVLPQLATYSVLYTYSDLDRDAIIAKDNSTALATSWCKLPADARVYIWVLGMNTYLGEDIASDDLIQGFVDALARCSLQEVQFPPECENFRLMIADMHKSPEKIDWTAFLDRLLQGKEFYGLCLKSWDSAFARLSFSLAYHLTKHFGEFLYDADAFDEIANLQTKLRVAQLYHYLFGLEVNKEAKTVQFRTLPRDEMIGVCLLLDLEVLLEVSRHNAAFVVHFIKACDNALQEPSLQKETEQAVRRTLQYVLKPVLQFQSRFALTLDEENTSPCELLENEEDEALITLNKPLLLSVASAADDGLKKVIEDALNSIEPERKRRKTVVSLH
ncbi:MAG: hypothetical protein MHM6MM_003081 [Cercozoa sp. M6MM]